MASDHKAVIGDKVWMAGNNVEGLDAVALEQFTIAVEDAGKALICMDADDDLRAVFSPSQTPHAKSLTVLGEAGRHGACDRVWKVADNTAATTTTYAVAERLERAVSTAVGVLPPHRSPDIPW
ncbi:unnamed protein product [Hyaloperonospora brassicae]|uniref:Uncharacterized protein n=1 Tax=Hyaloperonospora brassicae TaxID=162125 RepID=A0AAV0TJ58_HYABA|nr:unnamed protein product [Hyaloperonospora brassicae]